MKRALLSLCLCTVLWRGASGLDGDTALIHRLTSGQTMAAVARLYGVPLANVVAANPGLNPHRLEVGTPITVPAPAGGWPELPMQPGDTLESVALRLNLPPESLRQLNPAFKGDEVIVVPRLEAAPVAAAAPANPPEASPVAAVSESPPAAPNPVAGDWELVTLADGRRGWAPRAALLIPAVTPQSPEQVVALAQRFVGAPYRWGGQSPNGVDCSGFVQEVFRLCGHGLPRLADEQFEKTTPVDTPQCGDLLFFTTYLPGPSHVGISLGGNEFLHASSSRGVIRASLDEPYFKSRYLGARRLPVWAGSPVSRQQSAAGAASPP